MKARDIANIIEEFAPSYLQEDWDNSGFCIGDTEQEITGIMLSLDCDEYLLDEAIEKGCNMIITHHPLIFKGVKKILSSDRLSRVVEKAIRNYIVIYSTHTPIDKVAGGVSWQMASRLGLVNTKTLSPENEHLQGLGVIGDLECEMDVETFFKHVKESYGLDMIRCSKPTKEKISRVALCGGSGHSLIGAALKEQADAMVTGDLSYHQFFVEQGLILVDIGHYESEKDIIDIIFSLVRKKIPNFAVLKSERSKNLVYYY